MTAKTILRFAINIWRLLVCSFAFLTTSERTKIEEDIQAWNRVKKLRYSSNACLWEYMLTYKEFRNLYIYRIKQGKGNLAASIIKLLFPPMDSLYFACDDIGGGLFIQHGFSTIIAAKKVGRNCWVNQQVTIGYKGEDAPIIGDNARVFAGSLVLGGIEIGNNTTIGAGSVVVKSIPADCVVAGNPARIIKERKSESK